MIKYYNNEKCNNTYGITTHQIHNNLISYLNKSILTNDNIDIPNLSEKYNKTDPLYHFKNYINYMKNNDIINSVESIHLYFNTIQKYFIYYLVIVMVIIFLHYYQENLEIIIKH